MSLRAAITGLMLLAPAAAAALTLDFPARAIPVAERETSGDSQFFPTAPVGEDKPAGTMVEGALRQQAWRLDSASLTTLQILAPLRAQLIQAGFTTLFECEDRSCGGFDFRYQIDVLPEPDMHVNLGDFRYFSARRDNGGKPEYLSLLISRSANSGFVQLTRIGAPEDAPQIKASVTVAPAGLALTPAGPVGEQLEDVGHATLDDLTFKTGSSELGDTEFASLKELAGYLDAHPDRKVVLVGHTDAEGALDANIALSRRRAAAVAERLIKAHGVNSGQVSADGVGFLAPRASNLTTEGRNLNRRVEVILSSTQ
ncbi:MAG: OmpA family protein [Rhodobacter sp.]|nr:OmpA family protein [Rhodobacter sp.]